MNFYKRNCLFMNCKFEYVFILFPKLYISKQSTFDRLWNFLVVQSRFGYFSFKSVCLRDILTLILDSIIYFLRNPSLKVALSCNFVCMVKITCFSNLENLMFAKNFYAVYIE